MTEVDTLLGRLRDTPVPPGLSLIDEQVLQTISARRAARTGMGAMPVALAAFVSLGIGIAAGGRDEAPTPSPVSFGMEMELAPSTLLGSAR